MIFDDVRSFLNQCEAEQDLKTLEGADWDLEIGTISELSSENKGPALLFDKIKGYPDGYRVATNMYSTKERFAVAVGLPRETSRLEIIKKFRGMQFQPAKPVEVDSGPVMENSYFDDRVDLLKFPVPRYHEEDGGRYMGTGFVAITRDPDSGYINCGVERAMLHDKDTLGFYISPGKHNGIIRKKYWDKGEACPVVMTIGNDPFFFMVSGILHVPWGISELDWAGWMRNKPIEVIKGKITGIPFPANDEIVIEGECLPPEVEQRPEGPFGEWPGYYGGGVEPTPIVKVKAVYHRNNPIITGVPPMRPPGRGYGVEVRSASTWDDLEKAGVMGVKGVCQHSEGGGRMLLAISIKQEHIGHSKQAGLVAAGCHGSGYMGKIIIVVDDDIDPTDLSEVMWAFATRCDPETSIDIIRGCWGTRLDPLISPEKKKMKDYSHSVAIIDACKPFTWKDEFPKAIRSSLNLRKRTAEKWSDILPSVIKR